MEQQQKIVTIDTGHGAVRGVETDRCRRFLGVPFAHAGRFEYARPVDAWEGTLDAERTGPSCPQNRAWHEHLENPTRLFYKKEYREGAEFLYDEDCLNLNIFTPKEPNRCPVVIFFHGGGFDSGMNAEDPFDGSAFAEQGIITIFANYRVGPLGYLTHAEIQRRYGRDGNFGLDDQLTAVRWVKDHIAPFGGDPDNITLLGQSAGAISVQYLSLMSVCSGLFRRAAMMSGAGLFPKFALPRRAADTHGYWEQFMTLAGCGTFEELKALSLDGLFDAVEKIHKVRKDNTYCNMPVLDGCLLTAPIGEMIKTPLPIGYLIGYTNTDLFAPVMTWIGNRFARQTGAYVYYFDIDAPGDRNGAFHSCDLRYVFGTLGRSFRPYGKRDYEASRELIRYLSNFARTGNPNGEGLPLWKPVRKGYPANVLCIRPGGTGMGHAGYGKLLLNFLTKGEPKA